MAHKVSPLAFRIGYIKSWKTVAYCSKLDFHKQVSLDVQVRKLLKKLLAGIPVANIFVNYQNGIATVTIYTSRISLVLGKDEENVARISQELEGAFGKKFNVEVKEVKKPELSAALVADNIARQIEKKLPYRRVVKNAISKTMEKGGMGIKVIVGGRLNGTDIARRETYKDGNIPLQTIRADVDYSTERANTIYGVIGIKVWVYKGDIFKTKK